MDASFSPAEADLHLAAQMARSRDDLLAALRRRVVGQTEAVEHLLIALFARGHALFVGVPGLAKTLLVNTLAASLSLSFNRIQFTPDLMPADITGTDILEHEGGGRSHFKFMPGPIFTNILLADEVNRTPPKTQAALLQAMQEARVTAGGRTYPLEPPFHVFATQNPIEQEGTYPLPEAQLDRFMMMLKLAYPSAEEEVTIVQQTTQGPPPPVPAVLTPASILAYQDLVRRVPIAEPLVRLAVRMVRATRPEDPSAPAAVRAHVAFGAGPRAAQQLAVAAKARALLLGRWVVDAADLRALAAPVMRHRVLLNFSAEAERVTADALIAEVVDASAA